jgi:uncharacterized integral membrane protein
MRVVTWTIRLAVLLFLNALAARNTDAVTLRFFRIYTLEAPLIFVVLCSFAVGAALGLAAGALRTARARRELRRARRELDTRAPMLRSRHDDLPPPYEGV